MSTLESSENSSVAPPHPPVAVQSSQRSHQAPPPSLAQSSSSSSAQNQKVPPSQQQHQQQRSVKRPRPVKSCAECRKRKLRCDRLCPCSQCQKSNRACQYTEHDPGNLSEGSDGEQAEVSRPTKRAHTSGFSGTAPGSASEGFGRGSDLNTTGGQTFVEDLAVRMDRLERCVMSRCSGSQVPSGSGPLAAPGSSIRGLSIKHDGDRTRYFGQSSPRVLLNLFRDAKDHLHAAHRAEGLDDTLHNFQKLHEYLRELYRHALTPIPVFVDSVMPIWKRMTDILPKKDVCDRLVTAYMDHSEAICRIIHFPTFSERYNLFWEGKLQSECFLPQLLAIISIASRFTPTTRGFGHERVEGAHLPTAYALVRSWVDGLKGKQRTDLGILQVEMLLIVCQRILMVRSDTLWTEMGSIVRMAMTMGLQRDPSEFEPRMSPFAGEIRRRLWFSVLDLDVQISMQNNMPCSVRDGDYTCRPPRNLDDGDLHWDMRAVPPGKPLEQSTQCQLLVLAASSVATRLRICHLLPRIDAVRDFQEVLELGTRMEESLEDMEQLLPRKGITDHSRTSRLWRERITLDSHMRCALLMLYRPFAAGGQACPPQVSRAFLRSCMTVLQWADELDPMLPHYQGTMGVLQQLFKSDMVVSAFGVCYFVGALRRSQANGVAGGAPSAVRLASHSPGPDNSPPLSSESMLLWSSERLVAVVERTLDRFTRSIQGTMDAKDIITLCIVLETVRTPEPRHQDVARALNMCLDKCLETTGMSREKLDSYGYGGRSAPHHGPSRDDTGWELWSGWEW